MKTLNGIVVVLILSLTLTGCMPESLTKFKEDAVKKDVAVTDKTFVDDSGNAVDTSEFTAPTSLSYDNQNLVVSSSVSIAAGGSLGDLVNLATSADLTTSTDITISYSTLVENYDPVFAITPSLPSGLTLNTTTGIISGAPTQITGTQTHTISLQYTDPNDLTTNTLTTTFTTSVQEVIDGSFRMGFGSGSVSQKMYLEVNDVSNFSASGSISAKRSSGETTAQGTIAFVDEDTNSLIIDVSSGEFKISDEIDNSSSYVATEATVSKIGYYFETTTGSTNNIDLETISDVTNNLDNSLNSTVFSISPDLPSGLTFDTTTGQITGRVSSAVAAATYIVTATNDIDSIGQSTQFDLSIVDIPSYLSYNRSVVFTVDNSTGISVGDTIATSIVPPLTEGAIGEVRYIDSVSDHILVNVISGEFVDEASVDINDTYVDEDTTITSEPVDANTVLNVSAAGDFASYSSDSTKAIICVAGVALGTITDINSTTLYVSQTKTTGFIGEFTEGATVVNDTTCDNNSTGATTTATISDVWSSSILATVTTPASFAKGEDVYVDGGDSAGYISDLNGSVATITMYTQSPFIAASDTINSSISAGTSTITNVSSNLKIELTRGESTSITPFLTKGSEAFYSISPTLPDGLSIDSTTGIISGTPTEATSNTSYTVTAQNAVGSYDSQFNLQVYDYFQLIDNSGTKSYVLHKAGQLNKTTKCRVNKEQIDDFALSSLTDASLSEIVDIECYLEAGETDLYTLGMSLSIDSGPDVCEFSEFMPYSFFQYRPGESDMSTPEFAVVSGSCSDSSGDEIADGDIFHIGRDSANLPTSDATDVTTVDSWNDAGTGAIKMDQEEFCHTYYKELATSCDTGEVVVRTISLTDGSGANCSYTISDSTVTCGGTKASCVGGAIKDVFSESEIEQGVILQRTDTKNGDTIDFSFSPPINEGYSTNISLANYTAKGSCTDGTYDNLTDGWKAYANEGSFNSVTNINSPQRGRQPYYTSHCTNSAGEIKARIRLIVRDWDTAFSKSSIIDRILDTTLMDVTGTDTFGSSYNDKYDWDNFQESSASFTGTCDDTPTAPTSTGGAAVATTIDVDTWAGSIFVEKDAASASDFTSLSNGMTIFIGGTTEADKYTIKRIIDSDTLLLANPVSSTLDGSTISYSPEYFFPLDNL